MNAVRHDESFERGKSMGTASSSKVGAAAWLVGPAFLGLAAWLWLGGGSSEIPGRPDVPVDLRRLSTAPRRVTIGDPPTIRINNYERHCNDCHQVFEISAEQRANRMQHQHVELQHGINVQCRHCHDARDMNGLLLRDETHIAFADVDRLCAQCHAQVHDDWRRGIHGRINGYWDPSQGEVRKLGCIECHDPHQPRTPAMDRLQPLPGPHTLRMGEPAAQHEVHPPEERDPLRRAAQGLGASKAEEHR